MKFQIIKDGSYEDGGVFQPAEEAYSRTQAFVQECNRLLQLYCSHKARFNDKQYWQIQEAQRGNAGANERNYVSLALTSVRLALQEADSQAAEHLSSLALSRDALGRNIPGIRLASRRNVGMNNWILLEALYRQLHSLQARVRSTVEEDVTNGLGIINLGKYFSVLRCEALEGAVREADANQLQYELAYLPSINGHWTMNTPDGRKLSESVKAMQTLLNKFFSQSTDIQQLTQSLDRRKYWPRMDEARKTNDDEVYYRLLSELSVAQSNIASLELELVLMEPEIQAASKDLYTKQWHFAGAKERQPAESDKKSVNILTNNFIFAEILNRKAVVLLKRIGNIIGESRSMQGLMTIFNQEVPFPVRGIGDSDTAQ
ncbi:MAG: hypothetical protein K2W82_14040 [Candidatus Obscuribacterales bacterium]|nr:hypothetical protein [Candidatus Obscuribacterales bacterium]